MLFAQAKERCSFYLTIESDFTEGYVSFYDEEDVELKPDATYSSRASLIPVCVDTWAPRRHPGRCMQHTCAREISDPWLAAVPQFLHWAHHYGATSCLLAVRVVQVMERTSFVDGHGNGP